VKVKGEMMQRETQLEADSVGHETHDSILDAYKLSISALIMKKRVEGWCTLEVERKGLWFVLAGPVDSQSTKRALISLVPELDGVRYVVDRLHVEGVS